MSVIDRAKKYVEAQEKRGTYSDRDDRRPQNTKNSLKQEFQQIKKELDDDRREKVEELANEFNKKVGGS